MGTNIGAMVTCNISNSCILVSNCASGEFSRAFCQAFRGTGVNKVVNSLNKLNPHME
jgi:hypothetical protein